MRTRRRTAHGAALLYVLGAGPALACPAAADLEGPGIGFTTSDGLAEVHRRIDADRIEVGYHSVGPPDIHRNVFIQGVYLHSSGTFDADGVLEDGSSGWIKRDRAISDIPIPAAGQSWTMSQAEVRPGRDLENQQISSTVAAEFTWVLGACSYTALPVTLTSQGGYQTLAQEFNYLRDLGAGILVGLSGETVAGGFECVDISVVRAR
ncbi:hypothetical protein V8J82_00600 [Gymnodinialimonas sp. 2305UL16-5]|uniref:hypothetical protein n=1 Tax=Gymnodinialimonas mytili TaxID=3126503 RepID=UPI00309E3B47